MFYLSLVKIWIKTFLSWIYKIGTHPIVNIVIGAALWVAVGYGISSMGDTFSVPAFLLGVGVVISMSIFDYGLRSFFIRRSTQHNSTE